MLFLRSRERAAALKRDGNKCCVCGAKASVAKGREVKVEVHHLEPIDWQPLFDAVREHLLCNPEGMICLCKKCHKEAE